MSFSDSCSGVRHRECHCDHQSSLICPNRGRICRRTPISALRKFDHKCSFVFGKRLSNILSSDRSLALCTGPENTKGQSSSQRNVFRSSSSGILNHILINFHLNHYVWLQVRLYLDLHEKYTNGVLREQLKFKDVYQTVKLLVGQFASAMKLLKVRPVFKRQQDNFDKILKVLLMNNGITLTD